MRVVIDLQACQTVSRHRGIGRYSMSLAQEMARQAGEHEIWLALNNSLPDSIEDVRASFDGLVDQDRIVVFDLPNSVAGAHPANDWRRRAAELIRQRSLARLAPDVVHVASVFEGFGDDAITSGDREGDSHALAVTLYDLIPFLRQDVYFSENRTRDWYLRKLEYVKDADLLLAISEHSRREALEALELPADQVVTISTAADDKFRLLDQEAQDTAQFARLHGLTRPFLMYTGGIDHRKNIGGLIESYARLPQPLRDMHQLAIVCSVRDIDRVHLGKLAAGFGLGADEMVLTGFVSDEDLVGLYNACSLFVFPSLHEGFGLPVLEAMSCGAPVIGSDASSIPEVIGRADALFDPTDPGAIVAKVQQALTDEAFRSSLRSHGLQQAKRFSWWATARRTLDAFEGLHAAQRAHRERRPKATACRPRLAFVSPLPPDRSGIADYSVDLLPELTRYYEVEVVTEAGTTSDPWVVANLPVRAERWFDAHADDYDRIVYQMGNSVFHRHIFGLVDRHPGVVVLHDFFLSQALRHLDVVGYLPGGFTRALYESHGAAALVAATAVGDEEAALTYPCSKRVLDRATGVIVHSDFSARLADTWYGEGFARDWRRIPLLRATPSESDRSAARLRLGLDDGDFLVCSFGFLWTTKLNERLVAAWHESGLAEDEKARLVFVGECHPGPYGDGLRDQIAQITGPERVEITGYVSRDVYADYLAAADVGVQLRTLSRGETSASVLDCLARGLPTVANAHGSTAELPDGILVLLEDRFSQQDLVDALSRLRTDSDMRERLSRDSVEYMREVHAPARVAELYRDAIENFAADSPAAAYRDLIAAIAASPPFPRPDERDLTDVAASIAATMPTHRVAQLLLDVTSLSRLDTDDRSHLLAETLLRDLVDDPPKGLRLEPVRRDAVGTYRYARRLLLSTIGADGPLLEDELMEAMPGDTFLALQATHRDDGDHGRFLQGLRDIGVTVYCVITEVPLHPADGSPELQDIHVQSLRALVSAADAALCISRRSADGLLAWLDRSDVQRPRPFSIGLLELVEPSESSSRTSVGEQLDSMREGERYR